MGPTVDASEIRRKRVTKPVVNNGINYNWGLAGYQPSTVPVQGCSRDIPAGCLFFLMVYVGKYTSPMDPMGYVIRVYHEKHREAAQLLARPAFLTFQRGENSIGEASKGPGNWLRDG